MITRTGNPTSEETKLITLGKSAHSPAPGLDRRYRLGAGVNREVPAAYERTPEDPQARPLRVFVLDPAASRLEGKIATAMVPFEPLEPGPVGALFEVSNHDTPAGVDYQKANLDNRDVLLTDGFEPSESEPRFHQQMVYAVASIVHASFRSALGRDLGWSFDTPQGSARLVIHPHGSDEGNAWYDPQAGSLMFGYFRVPHTVAGRALPRGYIFTALSHDVVAHELTHAILDGLRPAYIEASSGDMAGFHEGFADLIALLHHFEYREALVVALESSGGVLDDPHVEYLNAIAQRFGRAGGEYTPLRRAVAPDESARKEEYYDETREAHDLGELLVRAVYGAFSTVYRRRVKRFVRLASGGSDALPRKPLPAGLVELLADEATRLAREFLAMIIRAIDYCPTSNLQLGEFLRAAVTADRDVSPEDPFGCREALIDAFRERGIFPRHVMSLNEDSLVWRPPRLEIPPIERLSFANLRFDGDPGRPAGAKEQRAQAYALGEVVTDPRYLDEFGLVSPDDPRLAMRGASAEVPVIESIRSLRRVGRQGRVVFDTVAEVSQACTVHGQPGKPGFSFKGGCTVIIGPDGRVRFLVSKSVGVADRVERRREYLDSAHAAQFWEIERDRYVPKGPVYRALHARVG